MFLAKKGSPTSDTENCCNEVRTSPNKKQRYAGNLDTVTKKSDMVGINCAVVNALNTLWVCKNAMNPKHECVYCLCHRCYLGKSDGMNQSGNRTTRGRRNKMKTADDQEKESFIGSTKYCDSTNHHLHCLDQFVDSLYFSAAYKLKIKNNNKDGKKIPKFVPFSCSECKVELVDKYMSI